ncbi:MAG TPA: glycosyltransferase family 2 protein [Candidatus Limenecus avicola]|jgi:glycosyltransferase, family 2|uniref:Glycosyltransferase family 2 protein n=1 Tax=Candidatus Limenecus avicola TaxID=2840847 RepID=A0A9D1N0Q8_9CLOT|nr:glycosyltransferase family 2 protein [Clostridium sp.]HIU92969.1 glycosyltransferase family 2 protein [Candidatus Limenecus avicola]
MKKISLISSCYNEEENLDTLYDRVVKAIEPYSNNYEFEYILLDNGSSDNTEGKLRELAQKDKRIKVILNARNFGHIRSPYYGMVQCSGDAIIYLASDLQDPPELIGDFIKKWEDGYKIVLGKKTQSEESFPMFMIRTAYYELISRIADDDTSLVKNCTGFGLFDRCVIDIIKQLDDPYPYIRGLICDIGFEKAFVEYKQPSRRRGISKNNFYSLYDNAMIGIVKHSKVPLRLMTFLGFGLSFLSLGVAVFYFILKLMFWNEFALGLAPIIISLFFLGSVQLFCMGVLGEYIGAIYTRVNKKPVVVEKERINF